jgi:hypothetical protein
MKRSPNCCYCEKPHGKSSPLVFQSCDACQDERDKREIAASNGLVSVSCPRCDLMFSADATPKLTDAEREAIERGYCSLMGVQDMSVECTRWDMEAADTLRGLLERTK